MHTSEFCEKISQYLLKFEEAIDSDDPEAWFPFDEWFEQFIEFADELNASE